MSPAKTKPEPAAIWLAPSDLKPWPDNPRDTDAAVERVAASIQRFGFGAPIVARADGYEIIAGHTRVRAALHLNLEQVPVRLMNISAQDAHLLALRDNRDTELTNWSESLPDVLRSFGLDDAMFAGWSRTEFERLTQGLEHAAAPTEFAEFETGGRPTFACPKCGFAIPVEQAAVPSAQHGGSRRGARH